MLTVLDGLVARDLVRAADGGVPLFRFRHPLLRTLLYVGTPPGRRITAHARAAEELDRVGAPLVQRASHLARSAPQGDGRSADLLARAAMSVLDTRPAAAASWLRAALRILPEDSDSPVPDQRFRIAALLFHAAERTGQYAECRHLLSTLLEGGGDEATSAPGSGGLLGRAVIVDLHSGLESGLGRHRMARALVDVGLAATPRLGAEGERLLCLRSAAIAAVEGDLPATRGHVRRRCAAPPPFPRCCAWTPRRRSPWRTRWPAVRRNCPKPIAVLGRRLRRVPDDLSGPVSGRAGAVAADGIPAAVRTAEALGDTELAARLDAVARLGWVLNLAERYGDALRLFARALGIARRTGRVAALTPLLLGRGHAYAALGRLSAAQRDAHEAEETASVLGDAGHADWARLLRAWVTLWCDGPGEAADLADQVRRQHPGPGPLGETAAALLGWIRLAQGRPEECLELVLPTARSTGRPMAAGVRVLWWSAAAAAASRTGAASAAREYSALAADSATACSSAGARAEALCARAGHAPDEAAVLLLSTAVELSAAAGLAVLECRVRIELAQRLVAVGRLEDAATEAGRAKERADRMDARWLRAVAVDAQRRIGACRPRRTSVPQDPRGPVEEVLSTREEQIVGMVCRGMSNREVAGALYVSVKTVEAHLTRIFRKTGARSRATLVAAFAAARPVQV